MTPVPRPAFVLGLAGLLPFVFGAGISVLPEPNLPPGQFALIYPSDGVAILAGYGVVILCFMSGTLWGYASSGPKADQALGLTLSVIPAILAFFFATRHAVSLTPSNLDSLLHLGIGFIALLAIDWIFDRRGLVPPWWMRLRLILTAVVIPCIAIGYLT